MAVRPADIRAELIRQGKKHFLLHGFEGSSLRQICNDAGVTTGAFYSNFEKKEDLFTAIVEPTVREFKQMYDKVIAREPSGCCVSISKPVRSAGMRSGVHCTRLKPQPAGATSWMSLSKATARSAAPRARIPSAACMYCTQPSAGQSTGMILSCALPAAWWEGTEGKCANTCRRARPSAATISAASSPRQLKWARATPA